MGKFRYDEVMEEIFRILQEAGLKPKKAPCVSAGGKKVPAIVLLHYLIAHEPGVYVFEDILHGDIFYAPEDRLARVTATPLMNGVRVVIRTWDAICIKDYKFMEGL